MVKYKNVIILILILCITPRIYAEEIVENEIGSASTLSIGLAPLTLLTCLIGNTVEDISINDLWFSISINLGKNKQEYDWFVAKYPHTFSVGLEKRFFLRKTLKGFFYGPFCSINFSRLSLSAEYHPAYSTGTYVEGDVYSCFGIKLGGEIGYRFKIKEVGITPKIGIGIPIMYLFDLDQYDRSELTQIYLNNMLFNCTFIGLKIDLMQTL